MNWIARTALTKGSLFGIVNGLILGLQADSLWWGVRNGVVVGALFGAAMAVFAWLRQKRAASQRLQFETEGLTLDAPASRDYASGWLFLTRKRVVFLGLRNFLKMRTEIELTSIAVLREATGLRRGVELATNDGERHLFGVRERAQWLEALAAAVADAGGNARTLTR